MALAPAAAGPGVPPLSAWRAPVRVAIVGGGVSGLATAYALERAHAARRAPADLAIVLFEADARTGGLVRTERADGCVIDAGPDSVLTAPPDAVELCRALGLEEELVPVPPGRVWICSRGRLHPLPPGSARGAPQDLGALARSGLLSWRGLARAALEPFVPRGPDRADESVAAFFGRRLGREAVERLVEPVFAGIYAAPPDRLSAAATVPQLRGLERRYGSLWRGMRRAGRGDGAAAPGFVTLRGGMGTLVDALDRALRRTDVRTRTPVGRVARADRGYELRAPDGAPLGRFDAVVLATPAAATAGLLRDLDPDLAALVAAIPAASTAVAVLAYARAELPGVPDGHGLFVPAVERRAVRAVTFVSEKFDGRAPPDAVLVRASVGGAGREDILAEPDDEIVRRVREDLADLLGWHAAPRFVRVARYERRIPVYEVGHLERVAAIDRRARRWPGLALVGHAYRGPGIAGCVAGARRAAYRIAGGDPQR